MKSPVPGLRRVRYDAVSVAKISLTVQPGDVLDVSDDVAAQLFAASAQFKDGDAPAPDPKVDVDQADEPDKRRRKPKK